MKVCVIGNSHTACLKAAWDDLKARHPGHNLTFFAGPGFTMSDMVLDAAGRRLTPSSDTLASALRMTSGGLDAIALDDYDAFLVMALGFSFPPVSPALSQAVAVALVADVYQASVNAQFARMIRACTRTPIHVGGVPRRTPPKHGEAPLDSLALAQVAQLCEQACQADALHFVPQPPETLEHGWYTPSRFIKDAPRLDHTPAKVGQFFDDRNTYHMNTDYGRLWLQPFLASLPVTSAPA